MRNIDRVHLLLHDLAQQTGTSEADYLKLITFVLDRPGHDRRYALNSERLGTALRWSAAETGRKSLAAMVQTMTRARTCRQGGDQG